jgi:hypothetical protein
MELIDIPTEQTTAATDALVAIIAAAFAVMLSMEGGRSDRTKGRIWRPPSACSPSLRRWVRSPTASR